MIQLLIFMFFAWTQLGGWIFSFMIELMIEIAILRAWAFGAKKIMGIESLHEKIDRLIHDSNEIKSQNEIQNKQYKYINMLVDDMDNRLQSLENGDKEARNDDHRHPDGQA